MDAWAVAIVVLTILAIVVVALRGKLRTVLRFGDKTLELDASRGTTPAKATITGSSAGRDATALGLGGAAIADTNAGRDLTARVNSPDPKA